jgi:hypothetical protein
VIFEIRDSFTTVEGPTTRTIGPGESSDIATAQTSGFAYCKVEAPGNKNTLRGHFAIEVLLGGGDTEMTLSVPLQ